MMKQVKHYLIALCLLPALSGAQEQASNYFLEITPDAQSAGMAGTGLALTDHSSTAIFRNLSTISFSQEMMGTGYSYAHSGQIGNLHSASLFYRIGKEGMHGFAVGFRHAKSSKSADFRPHIWDLEAGYFRNVSSHLSLSVTLRYLNGKHIADAKSHNAVCADFGATYHRGMKLLDEMASWSIAFQAANIGTKMEPEKLPTRFGLGGAIDLPFSIDHRLQVAFDLNYLLPSEIRRFRTNIGAEYNFLKYGIVRAGYQIEGKDKGGTGNYATVGCGINFWPIRADFAYSLADKASFMHRTWQLGFGVTF